MSGGYFDYKCFKISEFAEELQREIELNNDNSRDEYGDKVGRGFNRETIMRLAKAQQCIEMAGLLAREIEWLYSDDLGEVSFRKAADEIFFGGVEDE